MIILNRYNIRSTVENVAVREKPEILELSSGLSEQALTCKSSSSIPVDYIMPTKYIGLIFLWTQKKYTLEKLRLSTLKYCS